MSESRLIKRYANRKMYDTERSRYITLEEVAEMVRGGVDVRVIDNNTKDDLTEVTLAHALLSSERKRRGSVSIDGIRTLLAQGGTLLSRKAQQVTEPVARAASEAERTVEKWRTEAERTVDRVLGKGERPPREQDAPQHPEAEAPAPDTADPEAGAEDPKDDAGARAADGDDRPRSRGPTLVEQTQKAYDELQHRMDERVRMLVAALTHASPRDEEVVALRQRVEALEEKVAELEAWRSSTE